MPNNKTSYSSLLSRDNLSHLRLHFSFFLLPIFLFSISQSITIEIIKTSILFIVLHFIVYPASHAFNSYYDNDNGSIGGLEKPPPKNKSLLSLANVLDGLGIALCFFINFETLALVLLYVLASRAYSYRPIRLKQYPFVSFVVVSLFQGACVYWMVICCNTPLEKIEWSKHSTASIISTLLIASSYPISQIYQHVQDKEDGVTTMSMKLGIQGTMLFSFIVQLFILLTFSVYCYFTNQTYIVILFSIIMAPNAYLFAIWKKNVNADISEANYKNTMRYLQRASISSNIAFIVICIFKFFIQ
jgi:1,4-dihydroxy-2-naphthoate polyprenyltransferase